MNLFRMRSGWAPVLLVVAVVVSVGGCGSSTSDKTVTGPATLSLSGGALPLAVMGHAYSATVTASGGELNYQFDLDHSLLPPGVVAEWVDNDLVFHGDPTAAGTYAIPVEVIDANDDRDAATVVINVAANNTIAGTWSMVVTVTLATGGCAGEEGPSGPVSVTISQTGSDITVSGFLGDPANVMTGTIGGDNGSVVTISGTFPEDGGMTTATHVWTLTSPTAMAGVEDWSWTDGVDNCPGSQSTVVCTRASF